MSLAIFIIYASIVSLRKSLIVLIYYITLVISLSSSSFSLFSFLTFQRQYIYLFSSFHDRDTELFWVSSLPTCFLSFNDIELTDYMPPHMIFSLLSCQASSLIELYIENICHYFFIQAWMSWFLIIKMSDISRASSRHWEDIRDVSLNIVEYLDTFPYKYSQNSRLSLEMRDIFTITFERFLSSSLAIIIRYIFSSSSRHMRADIHISDIYFCHIFISLLYYLYRGISLILIDALSSLIIIKRYFLAALFLFISSYISESYFFHTLSIYYIFLPRDISFQAFISMRLIFRQSWWDLSRPSFHIASLPLSLSSYFHLSSHIYIRAEIYSLFSDIVFFHFIDAHRWTAILRYFIVD